MLLNPLDYTIKGLNKLNAAKGRLLIAEPFMDDPYFKRSVILLTEYSKKGAFGFILNKSIDININNILPDFPQLKANIFMGGPVQTDSLFYIHNQGKVIEGSQHIVDDLYWAGNFNQLKKMILDEQIFPNEIVFFLGYAGWDYRQLKNEINSESWLISTTSSNMISEMNKENLWKKTLQKMGTKHAALANFPEDPSLN